MILTVTDSTQLQNGIQRVKQGAESFNTNLFAGPAQLQSWIEAGSLAIQENQRCLLVFRHKRDFSHLYHVAADDRALAAALAALRWRAEFGSCLVTDIIGRPSAVQLVQEIYARNSFEDYTSLMRMVRLDDRPRPGDCEVSEAVFAAPPDASGIYQLMERSLDRFVEQLPRLEDIRVSIGRNDIIVIRRGLEIGGMLQLEMNGQTSTLRYWLVDQRYRDQKIGSQLLRRFFHLCRSSKRILLWVISSNHDAIAKYRHYGFQEEGLVDQIMTGRMES